MAKEGVEKAEETEQMIEKEAGKEPAEGGGGDGSHRLGDAQEMRAVVLAGFGGLNKLRLSRKAMPEPQDGELKIRVKACGLNFIDLMVRQGNIDNPPKTPLVPGFECSGIVEALGDSVKGYEIGDRVMAFVNYNAWAEVVCTPVEFVYKIPDDMSFSEAAAFPMNFVTAYMMLFEVANLREGMSVLVHSAGGGVGQAVAQLCSTVPNVTVFGTASTFKHEAIKDSVTHLFDRNADYVQEVKRISAEGVDIVLDCLCGDNTGKGLSLLKPLGTYILYDHCNRKKAELTRGRLIQHGNWRDQELLQLCKIMVAGGEGEPHQAVRGEQSHRRVFPFKSALQTRPGGPHSGSGGKTHRALQPEEDQACGGLLVGSGGGEGGHAADS
uniref:Vesicle amine transport 1 like n=1 Tax=Macaca fascicularis TaxID=9541 RepID=A0A7N9CXE7_MACFA